MLNNLLPTPVAFFLGQLWSSRIYQGKHVALELRHAVGGLPDVHQEKKL